MCPLIGYSFFQAVSLYAESSIAAQQSPVLAASLSPLDGVLVPTFGASYVAVTLLFPFVAIRVLGQEKESGTLRLLVQLPYRTSVRCSCHVAVEGPHCTRTAGCAGRRHSDGAGEHRASIDVHGPFWVTMRRR
jgi:hypothetical protein